MDLEHDRTVFEIDDYINNNGKEYVGWDAIEVLYIKEPRYYELKDAIMSCKQKGTFVFPKKKKKRLWKHILPNWKLWNELANYEQIAVFDCENVTIDLTKRH